MSDIEDQHNYDNMRSPDFFHDLSLHFGFNFNDYLYGSSPSSNRRGDETKTGPQSPWSWDVFASLSSLPDGLCGDDFTDIDSGPLSSSSPLSFWPGGIGLIPFISAKLIIKRLPEVKVLPIEKIWGVFRHRWIDFMEAFKLERKKVPPLLEGLENLEKFTIICTTEHNPAQINENFPSWEHILCNSPGQLLHVGISLHEIDSRIGTTRLVSILDPRNIGVIFIVRREELRIYFQQLLKLSPTEYAHAIEQETIIQDTVLILQAARKITADELALDKIILLQWALQFAAERDLAQSKTMMGCTIQDLAFVETINPSMNEKIDFTLQCIHLPQPDISPFEFISDQAKSGNQMLVSNISMPELLLQPQKGLLLNSDNGLHGSSLSSSHCGDTLKETNIQDTVLILQATRMPTGPTLTYHQIKSMTIELALKFATAAHLHPALEKTMRGSILQDLKFVEVIKLYMDESGLCLTFQGMRRELAIYINWLMLDPVESGNRMCLNISNQELLFQQQTPASARDLTGSSTCNESAGDFISRHTFKIQELSSSVAGLTHGGLMPSENVGISLNNLTTSATEAFPDHSSDFTTSETFESRDALERWYRNVGRRNGFEVVVGRSDSGVRAKNARITLVCERSGSYKGKGKNTELQQDKKLKTTTTKKCECPFKLKCRMTDGVWTVQLICGKHNHQCLPGFENPELQRKKMPSSCNILGGQDEAGHQMFESSLTTHEGDPQEQNRFQPNFGEGSSRLKTVNASNVESRETPTSQTVPGGMLTFSDLAQNQVMATLPHTVPRSTATQYERITSVKATYGKVKVKLPLSSLSGLVQLEEQVALRLRLELGSFKVEYQEHEDWFLIACDDALQECVEFSSSLPNRQISLLVTDRVANQLNG